MSVVDRRDHGFSLIEIVIALLITMVVTTSLFLLLQKGQETFRREPEISDMNGNARAGLDQLSRDLAIAGFNAPATLAVMWSDGGAASPDGVTVVYADTEVPVSRPGPCVADDGGACPSVGASTVLVLDPASFSPQPPDYSLTYMEGTVLIALQGPNGDPDCDVVPPGLVSVLVTERPKCTGSGGSTNGPSGCATLEVNVDPSRGIGAIDAPPGFDNDVRLECATVGVFHIVQYRVFRTPPTAGPSLERRDAALGESWTPVAANIENLQVQYAQGIAEVFDDAPGKLPMGNDPDSWITRVRISIDGRTASTDLKGATAGVLAAGEPYLRRNFTTTVSLRNQLTQAQQKAFELGLPGWN
jgi:type II secretory pathway pseudopilin PulG